MQNNTQNAQVVCCLWLLAGFAGAAAVAVGLLHLLDSEPVGLAAAALILAGGAVAAASWHRSRAALEHAEKPWTMDAETWSTPAARVPYADVERAGAAKARPASAAIGPNR